VAVERALVRSWEELVAATLRRPLAESRVRDEGETFRLLETLREAALFEAQVRPLALSHGLALVALAVATALFLGPCGSLSAASRRSFWPRSWGSDSAACGPRRRGAWERFHDVARDTAVLLEATALLRAHGREAHFASALLGETRAMARHEKSASQWSATLGLLPAGVAVLAVTAPSGAAFSFGQTSAQGLAELGILGGAGLLTGLSFARVVEQAMRGAPARATWNALLREHRAEPDAARGGRALGRSLVAAELAFDGVSCVFPGASNATPLRATGRLAGPGGLAIAGANGAGKSTLGLALLGLVRPTRGAITVDGVPLGELAEDALRSRVTYLPQGAFAASAASVAWHLRLVARERPSDAQIDAALGEVGLLTRLEEHGAKAGCAPRDVPAGELSGGERQRMHLARLFLEDSELGAARRARGGPRRRGTRAAARAAGALGEGPQGDRRGPRRGRGARFVRAPSVRARRDERGLIQASGSGVAAGSRAPSRMAFTSPPTSSAMASSQSQIRNTATAARLP
jgi:ABC-type multidrug transport system fused ATPase/permease subunit